jgi:hypothetical protein
VELPQKDDFKKNDTFPGLKITGKKSSSEDYEEDFIEDDI